MRRSVVVIDIGDRSMSSRKGSTLSYATLDAEQVSGTKDVKLRYSTIRCGLNPLRRDKQHRRLRKEEYQLIFQKIAHSIGAYRHVVTLVANYLVLEDPLIAGDSWRNFYYRVWSAVERVQKKAPQRKGRADYRNVDDKVEAILREHCIECLPDPVNVDLRMQEGALMATQTIEYLGTFYSRLRRKLNVQIASLCPKLDWKQVDSVTTKATNYVFCSPSREEALLSELVNATSLDVNALENIVREERQLMSALVKEGRDAKSWIASMKDNELYKLMPHMIRISAWSEEWLQKHFGLRELENEEKTDFIDKESGRTWNKQRLPKTFSALPISKLQAAMVLYTATEVKAMMELYESLYTTTTKAKKRKRGEADDDGVCIGKVSIEEYYTRKFGVNNFGDVIFNCKSFKGKRAPFKNSDGVTLKRSSGCDIPKWTIASFRTDGTSASITFVSGVCPPAFNTDNLFKKGYDHILEPQKKVNVYDGTARGLYFVGQYKKGQRNDIEPVEESVLCESPLLITAVDPGFCKPVHYATVQTNADNPITKARHAYVTEDEWMSQSGRKLRKDVEEKRVKANSNYREAIEKLAKCGGRRSTTSNFCTYFKMMISTLKVRFDELVCESRSKIRWRATQRHMQFISQLCDKMFDRSTLRFKRQHKLYTCSSQQGHSAALSSSLTNEAEKQRQNAEAHLHEKRVFRHARANSVVFFGNATFGPSTRGHNSIPKKRILHELSHRGLTFLLDEYKTSMQCPCGMDELTTTAGRNRAHKSDGTCCSLLQDLGNCDRDALASLNMIQCAICAIRGAKRPLHLCRSKLLCLEQEGTS